MSPKRDKQKEEDKRQERFWAGLSSELNKQYEEQQQASADSRIKAAAIALRQADNIKKKAEDEVFVAFSAMREAAQEKAQAQQEKEQAQQLQEEALAWASREQQRLQQQFDHQQAIMNQRETNLVELARATTQEAMGVITAAFAATQQQNTKKEVATTTADEVDELMADMAAVADNPDEAEGGCEEGDDEQQGQKRKKRRKQRGSGRGGGKGGGASSSGHWV